MKNMTMPELAPGLEIVFVWLVYEAHALPLYPSKALDAVEKYAGSKTIYNAFRNLGCTPCPTEQQPLLALPPPCNSLY